MSMDGGDEPLEAIVVETRRANPVTTIVAWACVALVLVFVGSWIWTRWSGSPWAR